MILSGEGEFEVSFGFRFEFIFFIPIYLFLDIVYINNINIYYYEKGVKKQFDGIFDVILYRLINIKLDI